MKIVALRGSAPATTGAARDVALVQAAQHGDREAFGALVTRYQHLVCSIAYCATGSLSQTEELAQEAFVEAWSRLGELRRPESFRNWLCRIARSFSLMSERRKRRAPFAAFLQDTDAASPDPSPLDRLIAREEDTLARRALGRIPEMYRVPLLMFYREHKSAGDIARSLDLTEDAVKQRLARGRKMLQEEVVESIAEALSGRPQPRQISASVLAALPASPAVAPRVRMATGTAAAVTAVALVAVGVHWAEGRQKAGRGPTGAGPPVIAADLIRTRAAPGRDLLLLAERAVAPAPAEAAARRIIHSFDFEPVEEDLDFRFGEPADCPPGVGDSRCQRATVHLSEQRHYLMVGWKTSAPSGHDFFHSKGLVLTFDYWLGGSGDIGLQVYDGDKKRNFAFGIAAGSPDRWMHIEVPLGRFRSAATPAVSLEEGDAIRAVQVSACLRGAEGRGLGPFAGEFYVANLRVEEK